MPVNPVFQLFTSSRACLYFNITLPSVGYKKKKRGSQQVEPSKHYFLELPGTPSRKNQKTNVTVSLELSRDWDY